MHFDEEEIWCSNCEMLWCTLYYSEDYSGDPNVQACPFCGDQESMLIRASSFGFVYAFKDKHFEKWLEGKHGGDMDSAAKEIDTKLDGRKTKWNRLCDLKSAWERYAGPTADSKLAKEWMKEEYGDEYDLRNEEDEKKYRELSSKARELVKERREQIYEGDEYHAKTHVFPSKCPHLETNSNGAI